MNFKLAMLSYIDYEQKTLVKNITAAKALSEYSPSVHIQYVMIGIDDLVEIDTTLLNNLRTTQWQYAEENELPLKDWSVYRCKCCLF